MRRMDGLSAFLYHQEQTGAVMHTLKISILDISEIPGGWDYALFRKSIAQRQHLLPMFRWKALKVPFGLHHPVWVDDPDFDLDYHVRRIACPAPGDRKAFCELVSEVYAWPLDMTKPLWLCWVVEGLENDEVAMVTLVHHAYTDGSGAARLLHKIYSLSQEDADPQQQMAWVPEKTPGKLSLLVRALIDLPRTWITSLPKIRQGMRNVREMKKKYAESGGELPPSAFTDTRDSPFNIMVGRGRTFVFDTLPLDEIKAISKGFDVTINDLFVAATAGAYRKFMQTRGYNPDTGPLVTAIPVSKRPPLEEDDMIGNKTSSDYLAMPVHLPDPLDRLKAAAHAGKVMKAHIVAAEGSDLSNILEITPPALIRLLDWVVKHKDGKFGVWGNAAISNVPGPREPLYMGAMKLKNWISMGMVAHGLGLNTTVWSYAGQFNLCILADKKLLPDGWELIAHFRDAFAEYRVLLDEKADRQAADTK
jgi:diacylglycerol O-acyltransferase / wax synthase